VSETAQVVDTAGGRQTGVKEKAVHGAALAHFNQGGETMFGEARIHHIALVEGRGGEPRNPGTGQGAGEREALRGTLIDQQDVDGVVADGEHRHLVHRFQRQ
jgi:hypothetical protein